MASMVSQFVNLGVTFFDWYSKVKDFDSKLEFVCKILEFLEQSDVEGMDSEKIKLRNLVYVGQAISALPIFHHHYLYKRIEFGAVVDKKVRMFHTLFIVKATDQQHKMLLKILQRTNAIESRFGSNGDAFGNPKVVGGPQYLLTKILQKMDADQKNFLHQESSASSYPPKTIVTRFPGIIIPTPSQYNSLVNMVTDHSIGFLNISGPRSCGKTAFAYKLIQDPEVIEVFRDNIYYTNAYGTPMEVVVADLCRTINYGSLVEGIDINALRVGIMNKGPGMIIVDDAVPEWETFLQEAFLSSPGCKFLVLSNSKFLSFEGYDLTNICDKAGKAFYISSENPYDGVFDFNDLKNKFYEDAETSPSKLEGLQLPDAQPLLMWQRRSKISLKDKSAILDAAPKLPQEGSSSSTFL